MGVETGQPSTQSGVRAETGQHGRIQSVNPINIMTGTLFRTSTDALLNDLGWERLATRRLIHKLCFFHRMHYNNPPLPSYITNLITGTRQDATGLRLRNAELLSAPPIRLTSFCRSFIPATIRQWNILPEFLRKTSSSRDFARQVWRRFGTPEPPTLIA